MQDYLVHSIVVIGMSCKFLGADLLDEFWQLLFKGISMVSCVLSERWHEVVLSRGSKRNGDYWGNFIEDFDFFDH